MKSKAIIPLIVGVGTGLLALKLGWSYIEQSQRVAAANQGDAPVVVARQAIPPGTELQSTDLKVLDWPRGALPADAQSDPEELEGRVTLTGLGVNLPVLETMLAPPGTSPGLPALIPPGYQAMAVKVDEFRGVGGFLKPGDAVDVVATFSVKESKGGPTRTVTRTILRNIKVSTVGQAMKPEEDGQPMVVRSVTLLVKPKQAQDLSLAATRGTITLALCSGRGGASTEELSPVDFDELLNPKSDKERDTAELKGSGSWLTKLFSSEQQDPVAIMPQPVSDIIMEEVGPSWQIRIIRGVEIDEVLFENSTSPRRLNPSQIEFKPEVRNAEDALRQDSGLQIPGIPDEIQGVSFFGE